MSDVVVWSGWIGGICVGSYVLFQLWLSNKQLGCSTGYGNIFGRITRLSFFRHGDYKFVNNWRLWFLLGLPLGGFLAASTSPGYEWQITTSMGSLYDSVLPASEWQKALLMMGGGMLLGLGARMAGGCTSGHVIVGVSLLNPPSLLAGALFFAGGLATVQFIFHVLA